MDISAEREQDQAAEQEPRQLTREELDHAIITFTGRPHGDDVIQFTPEQAYRIGQADQFIQEGLQLLDQMSSGQDRYGVPDDIEKVALLNAISGLMVEKGICTMAEMFVAKREAIAEQMEKIVHGAAAHRQAAQRAIIVPDDAPAAMAAMTREAPRRPGRKGGRRR